MNKTTTMARRSGARILVSRPVSCVICDSKAVTTAAHIPVCENHWHEYATEAAKKLPEHQRPVRLKILDAKEAANKKVRPPEFILFSTRCKIAAKAQRWCEKWNCAQNHMGIVTALNALGYLKEKNRRRSNDQAHL